MEKLDKSKLEDIIKYEQENTYIDFKKCQYVKEKNQDLIKDIMAMANANYNGEKYIIVGVKSVPGNENALVGIDDDVNDDAEYQQIIYENIEPQIKFSYFSEDICCKKVAYFIIYQDNTDRPYMMRKDFGKLTKGDSFKRIGSSQVRLVRHDLDTIYSDRYKNNIEINRKKEEKIKALNLELNLITKMKHYYGHLSGSNYHIKRLIESYKNNYEIPRWGLRNIPENMSEMQWKVNTLREICGFGINDFNTSLTKDILRNIDNNYFEEYNMVIQLLENDYIYLKELQHRLKMIQELDWTNDVKVYNVLSKIELKNIYNYFEKGSFITRVDFEKRIEEIKKEIIEIKEI
ncbi:MAG: ATP-binding protein [Sporomusaceae bacterium]|nr:ATP-binding protein [Sporomusaceae bacterium]